jgi:hypothetical protein
MKTQKITHFAAGKNKNRSPFTIPPFTKAKHGEN